MLDDNLDLLHPRDIPAYHQRQAAHFRALAESTTTAGIRARLMEQAKEHEQLLATDIASAAVYARTAT